MKEMTGSTNTPAIVIDIDMASENTYAPPHACDDDDDQCGCSSGCACSQVTMKMDDEHEIFVEV